MNSRDLLEVAWTLVHVRKGRPSGAHLRRAVSTTYYALFHHLAHECANHVIGANRKSRSEAAWRQVYRALEHGHAADRCRNKNFLRKFPPEIQDFANRFVEMQDKRHDADYSPGKTYLKSMVTKDIELAEDAVKLFASVDIRHRRAFCAYVLFRERKR